MHKAYQLLAAFALTGCAVEPTTFQITAPFDAAMASRLLAKGPNTIRGSALIRQRGGGVVTCAGQEVRLTPATHYANERSGRIYGSWDSGYRSASGNNRMVFSPDPPEYKNLTLQTICDAQGFFKFDKVANGEFLISTIIAWQVNNYRTEGGAIMQRVTVNGGETKEIVLTPR
ncbi:MAG TPA: hypothetical protein PLO14_04160 [Accumulibacter sp.]|uniref:hypothetical protein n=1 Tax=Accumulibacter sp. TaxID=2053492 RepID=UPI0025FE44A9|nr:hypothetical protein [Accumulibacter sp.]MCM8600326.1 hypothetical protein [Accumulibacter sp.]MCM8664559.1 hypothetical protein [Accumulibacter sp.]HNC51423.1 hypothetical protein [Accumulibacter sp.]